MLYIELANLLLLEYVLDGPCVHVFLLAAAEFNQMRQDFTACLLSQQDNF